MADLPSPKSALIDEIEDLLTKQGPMEFEALLDAIAAKGLSLGPDAARVLADLLDSDETPLIWDLPDGRYSLLSALLADRTLTHRVTSTEIEYDLLDPEGDLSPFAFLLDDERYRRLVGGDPMVAVFNQADLPPGRGRPDKTFPLGGLLLPKGTLQTLGGAHGDLIGLRCTIDGFLVEAVDQPSVPPADLAGQLIEVIAAQDPASPMELDDVIWQACADHASFLRTPLMPLSELLPLLGLEHDDDFVALPGFSFLRWRSELNIDRVTRRYNLDEDEAMTVLVLASMYDEIEKIAAATEAAADGDTAPIREIAGSIPEPPTKRSSWSVNDQLALIAQPHIASAALEEVRHELAADPELLVLLVETLQPMLPRTARPALAWMRAKAYQDVCATPEAEAALAEAEALDPAWPLTLIEMAQYASDRGDAVAGLGLLRRAGVPSDDEFVQLLQRFQPATRPGMRRNQPCWCGSGRKYKVCHLGREQLPLEERATWLYNKAAMHLEGDQWRRQTVAAAFARLRYLDPDTEPAELMADGLITDTVLFEGGGFDDFLAARGELLPDDERLLAQQWLLSERSVYEVESVQPGHGLGLRDLRTGDQVDVVERSASRQIKSGMLICAHVLPADKIHVIFGGIEPIELRQRDELMVLIDSGPEPADVVEFLSRRYGSPELQNTEGEPLVFCEATLGVPDPKALAEALDDAYSRADDGEPTWHEFVTTSGMQRIRATLTLDGDQLHVAANSETRYRRIVDQVMQLQPNMTLTGERRRDIDEIEPSDSEPGSTIDLTDPQVQEAVQQIIRQQEQVWLDEPIPALAGVTPRQAAADPTRRPDLNRLLDTFPEADEQTISMSPRRLRRALDLD